MYCSFDAFLTKGREERLIDWHKIVDHTRTELKPEESPADSIDNFMDGLKYNIRSWWERYTIDLWENQDCRLKIFVEKDALARLIADIALPYQVNVIPGRGYNSVTQLMAQAEELENLDKSMTILYFGDFDPSGLDIDRSAIERLKQYSNGCGDFKLV
jgi:hypothetical protein